MSVSLRLINLKKRSHEVPSLSVNDKLSICINYFGKCVSVTGSDQGRLTEAQMVLDFSVRGQDDMEE